MRRALIFLPALALAACVTQEGVRESTDQRLAMFEQVVFSHEYDESRTQNLTKWDQPIRIALEGDGAGIHRMTVEAHAKTLSDLTRLDYRLARSGERANVTIFFATLDEMEELAGPRIKNKQLVTDILLTSGCLFFFEKDARHRIIEASIFVRTGRSANDIRACLLEEMTQILGLPNDSDLVKPSIFNTNDRLTQQTAFDEALIRTLYDPSMTVGIQRQQALSKARSLLKQP